MRKTLLISLAVLSTVGLSAQRVTTYAGTPETSGFSTSGTTGYNNVKFNEPTGIAIDSRGNIWIADRNNNLLVMLQSNKYYFRTGNPTSFGLTDGSSTGGFLYGPVSLAIGAGDSIIIADAGNHALRKLQNFSNLGNAQALTTWVGGGEPGNGIQGDPGDMNGLRRDARMSTPSSVARAADGSVYVADYENFVIRKVTPNGYMSTFAGNGSQGLSNGTLTTSAFDNVLGIMWDATEGALLVSEGTAGVIRKIKGNSVTTVITGLNIPGNMVRLNDTIILISDASAITLWNTRTNALTKEFAGDYGVMDYQDGTGKDANFSLTGQMVKLNDTSILITDYLNHVIRRLDVSPPKGISNGIEESASTQINLRIANGQLQIDGLTGFALSPTIFGMDGRLVYRAERTDAYGILQLPSLTTGVYVLRCVVDGKPAWGKFAVE